MVGKRCGFRIVGWSDGARFGVPNSSKRALLHGGRVDETPPGATVDKR